GGTGIRRERHRRALQLLHTGTWPAAAGPASQSHHHVPPGRGPLVFPAGLDHSPLVDPRRRPVEAKGRLSKPATVRLSRRHRPRVWPFSSRRHSGRIARCRHQVTMNAKPTKRLVREGNFAAEVEVTLLETDGGWTPYLSIED